MTQQKHSLTHSPIMIPDMQSVNPKLCRTEELWCTSEDVAMQVARIVIDDHLRRCKSNSRYHETCTYSANDSETRTKAGNTQSPACFDSVVYQLKCSATPLLIWHQAETNALSISTKQCEYARREPRMFLVKLVASLSVCAFAFISSKCRQRSTQWMRRHKAMLINKALADRMVRDLQYCKHKSVFQHWRGCCSWVEVVLQYLGAHLRFTGTQSQLLQERLPCLWYSVPSTL